MPTLERPTRATTGSRRRHDARGPAPAAAAPPDPRRWLALALLAVAQFVVVLDASIMNIALPSIGADLHVATDTLSWVVNAYVLAFGGLLLLGGRLADLLGRRRVFIGGLVVFGAASLAGGLAGGATQLIAARAVQGLGAAALAPAALSLVTTLFAEGAERAKALGIWGAVAGSGGVAGVLLGGVLTSGLGWEWVLLVNVPVALGAAALAPRLLAESRVAAGDGRSLDLAGAALATSATVAAVYALVEANSAGWASAQTLGLLGGAAALLAAFVAVEARVAQPLVPLDVFRNRHVASANVTMVAAGAAMFGLFFFLSLYLQQVLGYSALKAGVSQLPLAGTLVVAAGVAGPLAERRGTRPVLLVGLALFAGGMAWFSRLPVDGAFLADVLGPSLLVGLGLALTFVALTIGSVAGVDDRRYGLASGLINTSQQIGGAIGLGVLTAMADQGARHSAAHGVAAANDGFQLALLVAAGAAVLALAAAALLAPRRDAVAG
jgi:EmrB/QacA subfamily drug resistance transporter